MKESKAVFVRKCDFISGLNDYQFYATNIVRGRDYSPEVLRYDEKTHEVGCQFDCKRDNRICTCRYLTPVRRRQEVKYFESSKQIYAYQGSRSFTEVGVGSVKALQRKKVKRIYLPETSERAVGSSDLSSYILRKSKQNRASSHYETTRTSSKCVGGVLECNTGCVMNEKLSPIIHTVSGSTSYREATGNRNIEIGSSSVVKNIANTTTQVEKTSRKDFHMKTEVNVERERERECMEEIIQPIIVFHDDPTEMRNTTSRRLSDRKQKDKTSSSDSLLQHVHNLENPSDEPTSHVSLEPDDDLMENKLEMEYRSIFVAKSKSKDSKYSSEKQSDLKSTSTLKRRFEALRRGLAKKDDSKKNAVIVNKLSSHVSGRSRRDVSINSDPPSLEGRSFSNTKPYAPFATKYSRDKTSYHPRVSHYKRSVTNKKESSADWSSKAADESSKAADDDSESQGVKGMFKLWGKKFNLEEDHYKRRCTPKPSYTAPRKSTKKKNEVPKIQAKSISKPDDMMLDEKKEGRKFFFFKKKNKEKPYKAKKGVTAGRCEVRDGLLIKILGGNVYDPTCVNRDEELDDDSYEEIIRKTWLKKFLTSKIDSRHSVKVRWNNKKYAPSSTVFELMDNIYKDSTQIFKSKSQMAVQSSHKSYTRQQYNFVKQNIEAWMIPKTIPDRPKLIPVTQLNKQQYKRRCKSDKDRKDNMEVRISDQKWFIDKSKAFSHKIEVVLHSKNFKKLNREESSEYLRIDIPKGFFVDSSSEDNRRPANQSSDEEVFKIVEYETGSDLKKDKAACNFNVGDHKQNKIKVTVSVKESTKCVSKVLETIDRQATSRDVVIQGSNVLIPKRCDVIGVGIITQRDLSQIRKPILKIQDDFSDEESEHNILRPHGKKCEFAESYLQEYYRHWTPLGIDLYSWCVSDSQLKCCSEHSRLSYVYPGVVTKSCPNIFDDFQTSTIVSSCGNPSCRDCQYKPQDTSKTGNKNAWFNNKNKKKSGKDAVTRVRPKDSIEVFKARKIYAASLKSKWCAPCLDFERPASLCEPKPKCGESNSGQSLPAVDCSKIKSCCKTVKSRPRAQKVGQKHVSMPGCDEMFETLAKQLSTTGPESILQFKGSKPPCDVCKKCHNDPKRAKIDSPPPCTKPSSPCKPLSCPPTPCPSRKPTRRPPCPGSPPSPQPCSPSPPPCPPKPPSCPTSPPPCPPKPPSCPTSPRPCPPKPPPCPPKPPSCPPKPPPCPPKPPSCPPKPPPCPPKPRSCPPSPPPCPPSPPSCPPTPPTCPPTPPSCPSTPPTPPTPQSCPPTPPSCPPTPPRCPPSPPPPPRCPPSPPPPPCCPHTPSPPPRCPHTPSSPPRCPHTPSPPPRCPHTPSPPPRCPQTPPSPPPCPPSPPCWNPRPPPPPLCPPSPPPCPAKMASRFLKKCAPKKSACGPKSPPAACIKKPLICLSSSKRSCNGSLTPPPFPRRLPCCSPDTPCMDPVPSFTPCSHIHIVECPPKQSTGILTSPPPEICCCPPPRPKKVPGATPPCPSSSSRRKSPCPHSLTCSSTPGVLSSFTNSPPACPHTKASSLASYVQKSPHSPNTPRSTCSKFNKISSICPASPLSCCEMCGQPKMKPMQKFPASPVCKPTPCVASFCKSLECQHTSVPSISRASLHTDAPLYYSPIHPCPPDPIEKPQCMRERCKTPPCKSDDDDPCLTNEQLSNQSSNSSGTRSRSRCKRDCPELPSMSCETVSPTPAKRECRSSCPNYKGSPRLPCLARMPEMQCPPVPKPPPPCPPPSEPCKELPPCTTPPTAIPIRSKSKVSGLYLKMMPASNKKPVCSAECLAWDDDKLDEGCISLSSKEKITIRLKKETPSTEEIREGFNIKVQDEDGMTLFERKDYRLQHAGIQRRPSLVGEVYKASEVHRLTTNNSDKAIKTDKDIDNDKLKEINEVTSVASIANQIEIQFKLKVTQGDKITEINITDDGEKTKENNNDQKDSKQFKRKSQEVFVVKNEPTADHPDQNNDINIRIVIKNFKPKSGKKKAVNLCDDYSEFSKKISAKFHTVSTGYSDVFHDDNVFSVHRATVDLSSSVNNVNTTENNVSAEVVNKPPNEVGGVILIGSECRCITTEMLEDKSEDTEAKSYASRKYSAYKETQDNQEETDTQLTDHKYEYNEDTDTEKPMKYDTEETDTDRQVDPPKYDTEGTDTEKQADQKYDVMSTTDTDEPDTLPEIKKSLSLDLLVKPQTKDEKKQLLKQVFEKVHDTKYKNKTRMRKLRDMLKVILTSDSSDHDDSKLPTNDLATDVTYASLKPNYFRDSDSMNNYYRVESNPVLPETTINRQVVYPTLENNSDCSNSVHSVEVLSSENECPKRGGCMCSTLAARLNLASRIGEGGGCCCAAKRNTKKNEEITCDLKTESDYLTQNDSKTAEFMDVQTQNSRYLTSKINSTNLSVHGSVNPSVGDSVNLDDEVKADSGVLNVDSKRFGVRTTYTSEKPHIRQCEMRKRNRNAILSISDEDKIVFLSGHSTRFPKEKNSIKAEKKDTLTIMGAADILQSYETKKAVLEIYTEKTISADGEHLVAKLPKFVYDREQEIQANYEAMATNTYKTVCKKNIVMMAIKR